MGPAAPLGKEHLGLPCGSNTLCHLAPGHHLLDILVEVALAIILWWPGASRKYHAIEQSLGDSCTTVQGHMGCSQGGSGASGGPCYVQAALNGVALQDPAAAFCSLTGLLQLEGPHSGPQ